eukprot:NODE_1147_length_981_cov_74.167382_g955_i0.p3 GENE.NODE_1147_length_981_cov_74.167382_g955_i0~~NODE_1147_length_981_cov_74.167382_g955_i0.p3  ORF type:complete len:63 (-),score=0.70 NODE_1147_length_981_cov_74.167382_g955_i0:579-767(-)
MTGRFAQRPFHPCSEPQVPGQKDGWQTLFRLDMLNFSGTQSGKLNPGFSLVISGHGGCRGRK